MFLFGKYQKESDSIYNLVVAWDTPTYFFEDEADLGILQGSGILPNENERMKGLVQGEKGLEAANNTGLNSQPVQESIFVTKKNNKNLRQYKKNKLVFHLIFFPILKNKKIQNFKKFKFLKIIL